MALPANPPAHSTYLRPSKGTRRLTLLEKRQRRLVRLFFRSFLPIVALGYAFVNLQEMSLYVESLLPSPPAGSWRVPPPSCTPSAPGSGAAPGSVAVVTGANSGLGLATSRHMSLMGHGLVVLGCRSVDRCLAAKATLDAERAHLCGDVESNVAVLDVPLDLEDLQAVEVRQGCANLLSYGCPVLTPQFIERNSHLSRPGPAPSPSAPPTSPTSS
jgi:hypothetical protein